MAGSPRNTIKTLYRKLQEQYTAEPVCLPTERVLLEHLVFAIFLENSPAERAFAAFEKLEDYFIDWNEIRVSTKSELADILSDLPFAERAADRMRRTLQWIFDNTYKFDLEEWRKKDIKQFASFLAENPFSTHFMNDFVLNFVLGAPQIPFDEGALRVMRLLDLVELNDENKEQVRGIDRTFQHQDAEQFFILLHQLGTELMSDSIPKKVMKLLKSVDPESENRTYISMVETDADRDPAEIARQMAAAQQPRRPKPSMIMEMDDVDLLDDSMESEFSVQTDEDDEDQDYRRMNDEDESFNAGRNREPDERNEKPKEKKHKEKAPAKEKDSVKKKEKPDSEKPSKKEKKEKTPEKPVQEKPVPKKTAQEKKSKNPASEKPQKKSEPSKDGAKKSTSAVKTKEKTESAAKGKAVVKEVSEKGNAGKGTDKKTGSKPSSLKGGKGKKAPEQAVSRPPDKKKTSGNSKSGKKSGDLAKKSSPKKTR